MVGGDEDEDGFKSYMDNRLGVSLSSSSLSCCVAMHMAIWTCGGAVSRHDWMVDATWVQYSVWECRACVPPSKQIYHTNGVVLAKVR